MRRKHEDNVAVIPKSVVTQNESFRCYLMTDLNNEIQCNFKSQSKQTLYLD